MDPDEAALEAHLAEFRRRLLYSVAAFLAAAVAGFWYADTLLAWFRADLSFSLHALAAYDVFYIQVLIAGFVGIVLAFPIFLYHGLRFAKPGLRPEEYRTLKRALPVGIGLFAAGAVFAYQVVAKNALSFFAQLTTTSDIAAVWGLRNTLGFIFGIMVATGLLFQIPLAVAILTYLGLLTPAKMRRTRSYVYVAILLLAAVLTPPDILTMFLITIPVAALYEGSILLSGRIR